MKLPHNVHIRSATKNIEPSAIDCNSTHSSAVVIMCPQMHAAHAKRNEAIPAICRHSRCLNEVEQKWLHVAYSICLSILVSYCIRFKRTPKQTTIHGFPFSELRHLLNKNKAHTQNFIHGLKLFQNRLPKQHSSLQHI